MQYADLVGKAYEANVSGGKAVVVVPDLKAGNHTVDVTTMVMINIHQAVPLLF